MARSSRVGPPAASHRRLLAPHRPRERLPRRGERHRGQIFGGDGGHGVEASYERWPARCRRVFQNALGDVVAAGEECAVDATYLDVGDARVAIGAGRARALSSLLPGARCRRTRHLRPPRGGGVVFAGYRDAGAQRERRPQLRRRFISSATGGKSEGAAPTPRRCGTIGAILRSVDDEGGVKPVVP